MKDFLGIINLSENEDRIRELTLNRPLAAIPIAGRYRLIDFTLSNMVNAGIGTVGIFTRNKFRSLMDHVGSGRPWDLDRKIGGLFILNPMYDYTSLIKRFGDIEHFKNSIEFIKASRQEYVMITRSYMLCNIDLRPAFDFHKKSGADVTILYKPIKGEDIDRYTGCDMLKLEGEEVIGIGQNTGRQEESNISMEMYLMRKDLLIDIIEKTIEDGDADYLKQAIFNRMKTLTVKGYPFTGYLSVVNSTENYYQTSMELFDTDIYDELFTKNGLIYTKIKDEPSASYTEDAEVNNAIIANGCIIDGKVENSIIFRSVHVQKGVHIKDSIIMQGSQIGEGAVLENVILDKNVIVSANKNLSGAKQNPYVIKKGATV